MGINKTWINKFSVFIIHFYLFSKTKQLLHSSIILTAQHINQNNDLRKTFIFMLSVTGLFVCQILLRPLHFTSLQFSLQVIGIVLFIMLYTDIFGPYNINKPEACVNVFNFSRYIFVDGIWLADKLRRFNITNSYSTPNYTQW